MGFSINLFGTAVADMVRLVTRADQLGFEAVWLGEHLVRPARFSSVYPYSPTGTADEVWPEDLPLSDPWVALSHLAAATEQIKLATGVYILPLRNPFVTARAVGTAQAMSGGRVILGIGAGWNREEFEMVGEDFEGRGSRTDEIIAIIRQLWSGESFSHSGGWYDFRGSSVSALRWTRAGAGSWWVVTRRRHCAERLATATVGIARRTAILPRWSPSVSEWRR